MAVTNTYATAADVQALFNQLGGQSITFGALTNPTLTQVEDALDDMAAEVDAALRATGYTVPATDAGDVRLIGRFLAMGAACDAFHRAFMFDTLPDKVKYWCDGWSKFLERIEDEKITLSGSSPTPATGVFQTQRYTGY